jgi:hypothetical protein
MGGKSNPIREGRQRKFANGANLRAATSSRKVSLGTLRAQLATWNRTI